MSLTTDPHLATPVGRQGNTGFATSMALLLIRLILGYTFIFHGSQKLFGWFTPDGHPMVGMLAQGLSQHPLPVLSPLAWAYIAALGEFIGGVFVFFGLLSRLATLPILVVMWVAIATVHGANGFGGWWEMGKSNSGDPAMIMHLGYEFNLALITLAAAILIAGPGLVSVDAFLFRRGLFAKGPQPLQEPGKRGG